MANHQKFLNLATRLIKKHGRSMTFLQIVSGTADPDKPWKGGGATDLPLATAIGVMVPFRGNDFGSLWQDFDLSKTADEVVLVAGVPGVDLLQAHKLLDGAERKIEWVQHLKPGGLTIMYAFGVNR